MKKMMSTLLTLAMCFCLFGAVPAQAAGGDFVVTDGVLLKYYGNGGDVVIPDGVTSIGERVFYSNQNITSVTIPEGVTYIGPNAFFRCKNMTSVKLPSTLETIQFSAFEDCDGLTELSLPNGVTSIAHSAFRWCDNLTSMTIPGSVTEIPDDMISGCINLTDVTFRYGVQKIAYRAFGECPKLKSVTIPNSVTYIAPISPNVFCEQPRFVVYGYNGSAAKTWAIQSASWGAEFVALDLPFTDVTENDYFVDPVRWATNEKITAGTGDGSTFSPSATCTNAQILSFLWRAAGSPDTNIANPFQNVSDSAYYAKAAIWAYENGIVDGSFNPDAKCTRATAVTYMWKYAGSPAASGAQFKDVPAIAPYAQAVSWAVKANITAGTGADTFSPNDTCTRAQIVTFLYRGFAEN